MDINAFPTSYLLLSIGTMILLSAYFSGTETAMMALNRYRLAAWDVVLDVISSARAVAPQGAWYRQSTPGGRVGTGLHVRALGDADEARCGAICPCDERAGS